MQKPLVAVLVDTAHVAHPERIALDGAPMLTSRSQLTLDRSTGETITDDELRALRDEAIESGDDGTRNIACGALNAVDEFQGFACRQACAAVLNAKRSTTLQLRNPAHLGWSMEPGTQWTAAERSEMQRNRCRW